MYCSLNGEFDIFVIVIEVVQKPGCCVFIVEQGEGIVHVSKPNRRASVVVTDPFLFKMAHKDVGQNMTELVRQSQIVQSVTQNCKYVLSM